MRQQKDCAVVLEENCTSTPGGANTHGCFSWIRWDQTARTHASGWLEFCLRGLPLRSEVTTWGGGPQETQGLRKESWVTGQKSGLSRAMGTVDRGSQHYYLERNTWKHQIRRVGRDPHWENYTPAGTITKLHVCQSLETVISQASPLFPFPIQPWRSQKQSSEGESRRKHKAEMSGRIHLPSCRPANLKKAHASGKGPPLALNGALCVDYCTAGQINY